MNGLDDTDHALRQFPVRPITFIEHNDFDARQFPFLLGNLMNNDEDLPTLIGTMTRPQPLNSHWSLCMMFRCSSQRTGQCQGGCGGNLPETACPPTSERDHMGVGQ